MFGFIFVQANGFGKFRSCSDALCNEKTNAIFYDEIFIFSQQSLGLLFAILFYLLLSLTIAHNRSTQYFLWFSICFSNVRP